MQQIYRRTHMRKCDFNKKHLRTTKEGCFWWYKIYSPDQKRVNASTFEVPGHLNSDLNFLHLALSLPANLSKVNSPYILDKYSYNGCCLPITIAYCFQHLFSNEILVSRNPGDFRFHCILLGFFVYTFNKFF